MSIKGESARVCLAEPVPVPEIFATKVGHVQDCGTYYRIILTDDRIEASGDLEAVETIVCRLVVPKDCWHKWIADSCAYVGWDHRPNLRVVG